ncbi:MAG TPA: TonB-dependent receptor [Steroidobacteraceae bacterium]|nr:TonB-dependent receptor [Steroidobacteraceae bacterium]
MNKRQRVGGWNLSIFAGTGAMTVLVLGVAAPAAWAQTGASEEAVEEVVVVGYRQSLNASLGIKRESVGTVDAIVAEDIADFPDLNLAEALQRVPGVSIQRDAGEGRQITVRGLSPEFTRIRLNGVEAMSANGGTDAAGGTNRARNFDFNTFASELFSSITVRKTSAADTDEGSLGATVDLRTGRPFDYKGFNLVASINGSYNDLAEDINPRAAFLVSNIFADGKFGALFSAAYTDRSLVDDGSSTVRWQQSTFAATALPGNPEPLADINTSFVPRIPRYDYYQHSQQRLGLTGALQFRPTEGTEINVDGLYAKFKAERQETFLEIPNFSSAANGMVVADAFIDRNDATATSSGTLRYGVFNNVDIRTENRMDRLSTEFTQVTIDGSQKLGERWKLNALVGFAEANHENPMQTTLIFDWNNIPQLTYDYRDNSRLPVIGYGATDLTSTVNGTPQAGATSTVDSGGWYLSQIRLRPQSSINSFLNYQADLEWQLTDSMNLRFGGQYKTFTFKTTELRRSNGTASNLEGTVTAAQRAIPLTSYGNVFSFGNDLNIPGGSNTVFLTPDVPTGTGLLDLNDPTVFPLGPEPALNNNREVDEDDSGAFAQLDFHAPLGSHTLRGNVGLRYVETSQNSVGYTFVTGGPVLITAKRDYSDTLPSFNLAFDLANDLVLRAGAAKVMSRPALGTLTPGGTVNVSGNNRVATLGNPNIDPTRAKNYDLGLEWYFAPESMLALALFYKDIESRPQGLTVTNQVFTGNPFGIPDNVAVAACGTLPNCAPDLPIWTFNTTINGPGGNLKGFEISYQQPFTFLPGALKNFGAMINYTGVKSSIQYVIPNSTVTATTDLTGLSRKAYNATLYYETKRFGARVSAAYRDGYIDPNNGVPGQNGNNLGGVKSTLAIDTSMRFSLNEMIEFTFEGLNLTDEFQDQWVDEEADRPSFYHHTGRTYILGARLKF